MHDSRVFGLSSLSKGLNERLRGLENYHILGDSAYTLGIHLMNIKNSCPKVKMGRASDFDGFLMVENFRV